MDSKRMFAQAVERLLTTRTLEEITVADIVAESGLSRSNFYNHFTDKYDLINWRHSVIHERRMREFLEGSIGYRAMLQKSLEGIGSYRTVYANSLGGDAYEALAAISAASPSKVPGASSRRWGSTWLTLRQPCWSRCSRSHPATPYSAGSKASCPWMPTAWQP